MKQELYNKLKYYVDQCEDVQDAICMLHDNYCDIEAERLQSVLTLLENILEQESPEITWNDLDVGQWFRYNRSAPSTQYVKRRDDLAWRFSGDNMTDAIFIHDLHQSGIVLIDDPKITDTIQAVLDFTD